ncbi:MAG: penicillin acylase family protein, partial [Sneathiella sp.]
MKIALWKKVLLACSASMAVLAGSAVATAGVQVTRDELGVPLIEADTNDEMWFALGYVQARDRIIQMEILRQAAFGDLPILANNEDAARNTRNIKQHHKYPNLRENLSEEFQLNPDEAGKRAMFCMAEGINYFIFQIVNDISAKNVQPKCLGNSFNPKNLGDTGKHEIGRDEIQYISDRARYLELNSNDWTPIDIAGLFHLQVMDEFSNRNTELNNLYHLVALTEKHDAEPAVKIFNSMKWALSGSAATTIPATDDKAAHAHKMATYYHKSLTEKVDIGDNIYNGCTVYSAANLKAEYSASAKYAMHQKDDQFPLLASNWWVVSQPGPDNGIPSGIMYNGPQISALDPARTYQVALKSKEGFQYAGNTFPGTINFWQGHNGTLSMGLTAGNIDVSDMFCVDVYKNANEELVYTLNDDEQNSLKQTSNDPLLYNVKKGGWPVVMIEKNPRYDGKQGTAFGTAYIQRYNWEGATVSTLISWMNALNETNLGGWNRQLDTVGANFNMVALNAEGTASYRLTGSLPIKHGMQPFNGEDPQDWNYFPSYDPRLPAPMAPDDGWQLVGQYYHELKHTMKNGVFANWNQKPFINMPDGDLDYDSYFRFDRVTLIRNELASQQPLGTWTLEDILDLNGRLQRLDVNYFAYEPFLKRLQHVGNPVELQKALSLILQWNGQRGDYKNPKGDQLGAHYGHVLFFEWINALTENVAKVISNDDAVLTKYLMRGLLKTKQPYFPIIADGGEAVPKPTVLTSHGIHVNSR